DRGSRHVDLRRAHVGLRGGHVGLESRHVCLRDGDGQLMSWRVSLESRYVNLTARHALLGHRHWCPCRWHPDPKRAAMLCIGNNLPHGIAMKACNPATSLTSAA